MKNNVRRVFSVLLAGLIILTQCTFAIAEDTAPEQSGAPFEIVSLKTEYYTGDEFEATLRYRSDDGTYTEISDDECNVSGFESSVTQTCAQDVTIEYMGYTLTCTVTRYDPKIMQGMFEWSFNEETGELFVSGRSGISTISITSPPWVHHLEDIRTITVSGNIAFLGNSTFYGCNNVEMINIESNNLSIANGIFSSCRNLQYLFLPDSPKSIQPNAFADINGVEVIYFRGTEDTWMTLTESFPELNAPLVQYRSDEMPVEFRCRTEYAYGERFFVEDVITYMDIVGEFRVEAYAVSGYDPYCPGYQSVTLSFGPYSEVFEVFVHEPENPDEPEEPQEPEDFEVEYELLKTTYNAGEELCVEFYKIINGERFLIPREEYTIEGFDSHNPGDQVVTVYIEGCTEEFRFDITVLPDIPEYGEYGELTWHFNTDGGELELSALCITQQDLMDTGVYEMWREAAHSLVIRAECIGSYAFADFENLEDVIIENEYNEIGIEHYAFANCRNLHRVHLPANLRFIQDGAFENCDNLTEVYYDSHFLDFREILIEGGNDRLMSSVVYNDSMLENFRWEFDEETNELRVRGTVISKADLDNTGMYEIWKDRVEELVIHSARIEETAFDGFRNLRSLTIEPLYPNIIIGIHAFSNCNNLTSIYLPAGVREIREGAFAEAHSLMNVYYEGSDEQWHTIGIEAENDYLYHSQIHYGSASIPEESLIFECGQYEYLVGDRYFVVNVMADYGNGYVDRIHEDEYIIEGFDTSAPGNYTVTVSCRGQSCEFEITVVPRDALNWNYNPQTFELTIDGEGEMGSYDHWWVSGDKGYTSAPWSKYLPEVRKITIGNDVTTISEGAFSCAPMLTEVIIGEKVERIDPFAFEYCTSLESITFPDSLGVIEGGAFKHCTSLENIQFGNGLFEINGGGNFAYCGITEVTIPDSLEIIGTSAFYSCQNLTTVHIPTSVTHIEHEAFLECNNLTDVFYEGTKAEWTNVIIDENNEQLIYANIHFEGEESEPDPEPEPEVITGITVACPSNIYNVGDEFCADVTAHTNYGNSFDVKDFTVTGFDSSVPGKQTVTVSYEGFSHTVIVEIIENTVEPESTAVISLSSGECMPGNTIEIAVELSDNPGFSNLGIEIEYDRALTLVGAAPAEIEGVTVTTAEDYTRHPYNISFDTPTNSLYNGNLVVLTFEVPDGIEPGDYFVRASYYKGRDGDFTDGVDVNYDENDNPVSINYENATITVYDHIPGDINGDGTVNNKDATYLLRYIAGWNINDIDHNALDTNGDSRITSKDGTTLLRHLVGWDVDIY